jgi:hypothetical protein
LDRIGVSLRRKRKIVVLVITKRSTTTRRKKEEVDQNWERTKTFVAD